MTVRLEDIRAGDEVTVRAIVREINPGFGIWALTAGRAFPVSILDILSHTPAPVVFEKGDVVRWWDSHDSNHLTVLATDDDGVWFKSHDGRRGQTISKFLTLVRKASAP